MNVAGKRVAILVHNYVEQSELEEPLQTLKDEGVLVTLVGADDVPLITMHHAEKGDPFQADIELRNASADDYDGLVIPGGVINADALRMDETAQQWATDFLDSGRPLAVICHAPWLLVSADLVEGRQLTSYYTLQDDIQNAGGEWTDQAVVIDGNLITSRKPDDLPDFINAFMHLLSDQPNNRIIGEPAYDSPTSPPDEQSMEDDARLRALGYDKDRDQLSTADQRDLLDDEDITDPDELHPSDVVTNDERDGTQ